MFIINQMFVTLGELKALIKEEFKFIEPEELKPAQWQDERLIKGLKKVLEDWNLRLIPSGKNHDGYVGKGVYGSVFEVITKDNKRMALKLTFDSSDAHSYKKLFNIQSSLPAFVKSALPHIYKSDTVSFRYYHDEIKVWATLIEFLVKPNESLLGAAWTVRDDDFKVKDQYKPKKIDTSILKHLLADSVKEMFDETGNNDEDPSDIEKISTSLTTNHLWYEFIENIKYVKKYELPKDHVNALSDRLLYDDSVLLTRNMLTQVMNIFKKKVLNLTKTSTEFPESGSSKEEKVKFLTPKINKLYYALRWLDQHNIIAGWRDLHSKNIMQRQPTGDLVAADIGLFIFL